MCRRPEYSRLCHLIDESLRPYAEQSAVPLTKQGEKDLLVVLSQVLRQIQMWTHEFRLYLCLQVKSPYVQHLAGNILVVISKFVVASGSSWDEFIYSLCVCLELAICNMLSSSLESPTTKAKGSECDSSSFVVALQPKLRNANWSTCGCSCLSKVPWDLLNELHVGRKGEALRSSNGDAFLHTNVGQPESRIVFHGNLVQFFCSLVEQSVLVEATGGSLDKYPVIYEIYNLIPKLLAWCFCEGDFSNLCISRYFKHKMLMLMIRLSLKIQPDCFILVSWLQLIHKYFQDLLVQPITRQESDQDDCLKGSPFFMSISDVGMHSMTSCHLQRLAVLLFLRCCFSLINLRERSDEQCACSNLNCNITLDLNMDHCTSFSLSFLQLYMNEDDILFEVLLQLFCVPVCAEQQVGALQEVKDDVLFHVSNLFNPIHLFHLFLAQLLYDHQVLLDYLISKDTGASSAEYLLRCLRVVCDSWRIFVEFSVGGKVTDESSCKKRKVLMDSSDFQGTSASVRGTGIPLSGEKKCQRDDTCGGKCCRSNRLPFEKAKECLLSLKKSVENLHQKNLFPYNPEVLLRRLTRFQELCLEQ
ncbi:hypothetical protein F0562_003886 [Nyssa sinensis]|uniref:Protein Lines C-terminal domain-containing protein n=1 Tax=Nyssa sinensis TaxID=561372 RepID=A0A5J5BZD6_9ASTE|nr:hypothetical protein F0562_003886 [Nyssa sinensis]